MDDPGREPGRDRTGATVTLGATVPTPSSTPPLICTDAASRLEPARRVVERRDARPCRSACSSPVEASVLPAPTTTVPVFASGPGVVRFRPFVIVEAPAGRVRGKAPHRAKNSFLNEGTRSLTTNAVGVCRQAGRGADGCRAVGRVR